MADVKPYTAEEIATEIANVNHECDSIRCSATGMYQHARLRRYHATIRERDARIAELEVERAEAMTVLMPSMPQSGLVDACRQVKQVAITEADNSAKMEAEISKLRENLKTGNGRGSRH